MNNPSELNNLNRDAGLAVPGKDVPIPPPTGPTIKQQGVVSQLFQVAPQMKALAFFHWRFAFPSLGLRRCQCWEDAIKRQRLMPLLLPSFLECLLSAPPLGSPILLLPSQNRSAF